MNQNKSLPFIIGGVVVLVTLVVVFASKKADTPVVVQDQQQTSAPLETTNPNVSVTPNTTTPTTFSMATIATHNSQSSCWTTINGNVYDVTKWISQHPGGAGAILSLCGKDGSAAFTGQHGGQSRPASELAGFKIGTLAK